MRLTPETRARLDVAIMLVLCLLIAIVAVAVLSKPASGQVVTTLFSVHVGDPVDSPVLSWPVPSRNGAIALTWIPASPPTWPPGRFGPNDKGKPALIFNHFVNHAVGGEVQFRVSYGPTYKDTRLLLSLGFGQVYLETGIIPEFQRGQAYHLVAFWFRRPDGLTEAGILINGVYAPGKKAKFAHGVFRLDRKIWFSRTRVGSRNDRFVSDPDFLGRQTADGWIAGAVAAW